MKRISLFLLAAVMVVSAMAQSVDVEKSRRVASAFFSAYEPQYAGTISSAPIYTYCDRDGNAVVYVFDVDSIGFVLAGANESFTPVVGYSFNGRFDTRRLPDNFKWWVQSYVDDVYAITHSMEKNNAIESDMETFRHQWKSYNDGVTPLYKGNGKSVQPLLNTRWDQGAGYNNYCPAYTGNSSGHSVTGCVATAMAQIIRYHAYPTTGFGHHSYGHTYFGIQEAHFDSAIYDYSLMPDQVNAYSPDNYQHAVSQLCYHCGVAVDMNYENPYHTSGSGASSQDVPGAFKYFGYTNSFILFRTAMGNSVWDSLLRHNLDMGLPVYYSGSNSSGGHAFVCDGYRANNTYHFNFGWSGYSDGFYSLSSVNSYSSSQGAVFNIYPSNLGPWHDTIYIDAKGTGDGSSWQQANPNLESALEVSGLYKKGQIWVKSGTYYGDTNASAAFTVHPGVTVYGGFSGVESSINQRDADAEPTILSGRGERRVVATATLSMNKASKMLDLTFADGLADDGSAVTTVENFTVGQCVVRNCQTTSEDGAAVRLRSGMIYNSIIRDNYCGALHLDGGDAKNCLLVHNAAYGAWSQNGNMVNCDIVSNSGVGVRADGGKVRNCVVWNNDSSVCGDGLSNFFFCAVEGYQTMDSNSNFGLSHLNRAGLGIGPSFLDPDTVRGPSQEIGDWHLDVLSPLVNSGDTVRSGVYVRDLDGNSRFHGGRVDIGCYESLVSQGVDSPTEISFLVFPNPTANVVSMVGVSGLVQVFDNMGRNVISVTIDADQSQIDLSSLPRGLYLIKTKSGTAKILKK